MHFLDAGGGARGDNEQRLDKPGHVTAVATAKATVAEAGEVDVLVANLAAPTFSGIATTELADDDWLIEIETTAVLD